MAWRFRQIHIDSGDILDPFHWNLNHQEFASEVNGYLDRDNFRGAMFDTDDFRDQSCNQVFTVDSQSDVSINMNTTTWQGRPDIALRTFQLKTDAHANVEYSAYHDWSNLGNLPGNPDLFAVRFRLLVDGTAIAQGGWQNLGRQRDVIYLVGGIQLPPGEHEAFVEAQVGSISVDAEDPEALERIGEGDDDPTLVVSNRELIVHARFR